MTFAQESAIEVLERSGLDWKRRIIDPSEIAEAFGITVVGLPFEAADGFLLRIGDFTQILYRDTIRNEGRVRFTIAHELGHWKLHPGLLQIQVCTSDDISAYRGDTVELEANEFAAELLMPTPKLEGILQYASPNFAKVQELVDKCGTSFSAAAVRLIELTDQPAIVVFSKENRVTWSRHSRKARHLYLEAGSPISSKSRAWNTLDSVIEAASPTAVDAECWFPAYRDRDRISLTEQSGTLGDLEITVTILTLYED